jgi:cobalt-precorrin 5A hydrolase
MKTTIGIWIVRLQALDIGRYLASRLEAECYAPGEDHQLAGRGEFVGGIASWRSAARENARPPAPEIHSPAPAEVSPPTNRELFAKRFREHRQWVLVMTTGIAVRYLQGLPSDKGSDPGVVVLDEGCRYAVSLSGGHEGGANQLAYRVANLVGAVPVITTATEALKPLVVGVGCRRDVSYEQINSAIEYGLARVQHSLSDVREIATIDLKQDEPGLNSWCQQNGIPLRVISRVLVQQRPWVTEASDWVRESVGVDGVCEPCALLATFRGQLLLPKTVHDGVTIAIAEESAFASLRRDQPGSARLQRHRKNDSASNQET